MRILFLSSVYPKPYAPTRGMYSRLQLEALAGRHDIQVVSPTPWTDRFRFGSASEERPGQNSSSPRLRELHPTYYFPPRLWGSQAHRFMWASVRAAVRRVLGDFRPDCVLSYWAHPDGAVAVQAARLAGVPVGILVGGSDVLLVAQNPARRRAIVQALAAANAIFVVSQNLREKTIELGVDARKVHLCYRGINHRSFCPGVRAAARQQLGLPPDVPLLLWVGRMVPVKGLDVLLKACALLKARGVDFRLALVGDGPLRAGLAAECDRLGISQIVLFPGEVRHEQLPDWYRAANLTVLSSYSEGVPNVLRESLACGTPYVSTSVGGVAELTDDPAVHLVPPGDPEAFAAAVAHALAEPRMLDPSRTRFKTWAEAGDALLRILVGAKGD